MLTKAGKLHRGDCVPRQTHSALQADGCDCLINIKVTMIWTEILCASRMKCCEIDAAACLPIHGSSMQLQTL